MMANENRNELSFVMAKIAEKSKMSKRRVVSWSTCLSCGRDAHAMHGSMLANRGQGRNELPLPKRLVSCLVCHYPKVILARYDYV